MNDQAQDLRNLVNKKGKKARVISVTSGKGGVGKTNISVNLAIALKEQGLDVVVIDCDLGLSNIEVMFGINPKYTLIDLIEGDKDIIDILEEGPNGIKFISGGSGIEELVNLDEDSLNKFIDNIEYLDQMADFIIIDTGAGISKNVINFVLSGDEIVLVTTPEPTAITDAYGMLKILSTRNIKRPISLLINQVNSAKEAQELLSRFTLLISRFLSIQTRPLGYLSYDKLLQRSVMLQSPVLVEFPSANVSRQIRQLSYQFSRLDPIPNSGGIKNFIHTIKNYFKS